METTLGAEAQMLNNHFFLGATAETWESYLGGTDGDFSPWESLYTINAGFRFRGFELGYRHECDHETLGYITPPPGFSTNRDEFYLSYKAKINIF
jgi:hypothetical protein